MGKTSKPLYLIVDDTLVLTAVFAPLREHGHTIVPLSSVTDGDDFLKADMIIGPRMWRMTEATIKYLPQAIKAARLDVYGPTKKRS